MEHTVNIIQWAVMTLIIPAVAWLVQKQVRRAKTNRDVHNVYKEMYDDIGKTLIELQNENKKLSKAVGRLERAISKALTCRYYNACPVRSELQQQQTCADKQHGNKRASGRQCERSDNTFDTRSADPAVACGDNCST